MILLADMFPAPTVEQMVVFLSCFFALGTVVLMGLKGWSYWKQGRAADEQLKNAGKPVAVEQPLMIKHVDIFVTKDDHRRFEDKTTAALDKIIAGQSEAKVAAAKREQSIKSANHRDTNNLKDAIGAKLDENMSRVYHRMNTMRERIARLEQAAGINPTPEEE